MAVDFVDFGLQFMQQFGLAAIIVLLILDGALLLPVFPGELVLLMAISTYVTDVPSLIGVILLTSAAALTGSILLYAIVRVGGRPLVTKIPGFFMMPTKRRERLERIFSQPIGQVLVLVLRFIPFTRILVNIPAGLAKMPFGRFVVLSTIGIVGYHAAFIGFAYGVNQPGNPLATQKEKLEAAYASPAWAFIESNQVLVVFVLLLLGTIIATKATIQKYRNPMEAGRSPIGWVTTIALLWGGIGLAAATYMEPQAVLRLLAVGGLDLTALAARTGVEPLAIIWVVAAVATTFGLLLHQVRKAARHHRRTVRRMTKEEARAVKARATGTPSSQPYLVPQLGEQNAAGTSKEEAGSEDADVDFGSARRL